MMNPQELASIICHDLNTYEEEAPNFERIENGLEAVKYLNQQWTSEQIQVLEATESKLHLIINNREVILSNQTQFGEWEVLYDYQ